MKTYILIPFNHYYIDLLSSLNITVVTGQSLYSIRRQLSYLVMTFYDSGMLYFNSSPYYLKQGQLCCLQTIETKDQTEFLSGRLIYLPFHFNITDWLIKIYKKHCFVPLDSELINIF